MVGHDQTPPEKSHSKNFNTNNNNFGMDPSNSYFVHYSNHPGHMPVSTKLNGTNYPSWSKSMIHALTAKNKIGFINGAIEAPSETEQPTEYALWNQCNNMILSWFTHSVEPDLAKGVIHAKQPIKCGKISKINSHRRMHQQSIRSKNPWILSHRAP